MDAAARLAIMATVRKSRTNSSNSKSEGKQAVRAETTSFSGLQGNAPTPASICLREKARNSFIALGDPDSIARSACAAPFVHTGNHIMPT